MLIYLKTDGPVLLTMTTYSSSSTRLKLLFLVLLICPGVYSGLREASADEPIQISGVYPSLSMYNQEGECGTGAVVPWQSDLWAITYAPHSPKGSSDKLYQISPDLKQTIFSGSVGGTPANRMIHRESNQLLIGPYLIDSEKKIRVIPPSKMLGRLTGNARHMTDPTNKVYYATMEEGLYEVDVDTLEVTCHIRDGHTKQGEGISSSLPGYHGKGLYSGQGHLVYTNNGEKSGQAMKDPTTTSGVLAQWFGEGDWRLVRRNQFTEATGPGGIYGNPRPETDPVWAMGWDAKSVVLGLLEDKQWSYYRLPKGSHSYDGAHGWNTEWPRIREIGENDLLATMHGTFWRFPSTFSVGNSAGIRPRSNYLKVIGDFCRWNDKIVLGCDDSAQKEFLNTRSFKAHHGAPKQSNSNLWFVEPETLNELGPAIGRGSVWLREDVDQNQQSDAYLFAGFDYRQLSLYHESETPITFQISIDASGNGQWSKLDTITVAPKSGYHYQFAPSTSGEWIRLSPVDSDVKNVTAHFHYRDRDQRGVENDALFAGLEPASSDFQTDGMMRSLAFDQLGLVTSDLGYYEIGHDMEFHKVESSQPGLALVEAVAQPARSYRQDAASIIFEEDGKRYRLPRGNTPGHTDDLSPTKPLEDYLASSLTRSAKVTTSSQHADYQPQYVVDGVIHDDAKRWISAADDIENWIEIDFGESKTVGEIWVVTGWKGEAAYVAKDFEIAYQTSSGERKSLCEVAENANGEFRLTLKEPVSTDKLSIISRNTGHFRIYEIAAFAEPIEIDYSASFAIDRVCREVATERDLLNVGGTFYELPARNAQGFAKIRPIATHHLAIHDFCSHAGLLFFTGVDVTTASDHIFRSADGEAAVWAGVVDDLWKLGKPRGEGGPWLESAVKAGVPSDRYLMTGYDAKTVALTAADRVSLSLEVDIDGTDLWIPYQTFELEPGETLQHVFPEGFSAYWVRAVSDKDTQATVQFEYR